MAQAVGVAAFRMFWLVAAALPPVAMPPTVHSYYQPEDTQIRFIEELKQRNADYGTGCNGVGVSVPPTVNMPPDLTTRWVAGHSACVPGLRLVMACSGEIVGEDRIIGCLVRAADGETSARIDCEAITLVSPVGRFTPDLSLTKILSDGSESAAHPCSEPQPFSQGLTVAAAFEVPAADSMGDLAILIDLDGSEVPAFLVPAGQLDQGEVAPTS